MTLTVSHAYNSQIAEDPASGVPNGLVGPNEWNAAHSWAGANSGGVLYFTNSTTASTDSGLTYSGTGATGALVIGGLTVGPQTISSTNGPQIVFNSGNPLVNINGGGGGIIQLSPGNAAKWNFDTSGNINGLAVSGSQSITSFGGAATITFSSSNPTINIFGGGAGNIAISPGNTLSWTYSATSASLVVANADTGYARAAAGVFEINNGTAGTGPGLILPRAATFATLPGSPVTGMIGYISDGLAGNCADGTCTTFGTNVTGGTGSLKLLVWYDGSHWTLIGK